MLYEVLSGVFSSSMLSQHYTRIARPALSLAWLTLGCRFSHLSSPLALLSTCGLNNFLRRNPKHRSESLKAELDT